jgi:hypothetical protein
MHASAAVIIWSRARLRRARLLFLPGILFVTSSLCTDAVHRTRAQG